MTNWLTLLSAGFPAVGTAIFGIRFQGDFGGSAERSRSTAQTLARDRGQMAGGARRPGALGRPVRAIGAGDARPTSTNGGWSTSSTNCRSASVLLETGLAALRHGRADSILHPVPRRAGVAASPAAAYWEYGHETVARIAHGQRAARHARRDPRAARPGPVARNPRMPGRRRSSRRASGPTASSRWATASLMPIRGITRTSTSASRSTSRRACKDGHCVSAQIERQARLLADVKVPERERLMALAFLVHFVGDLAQPMHAGDRGDLGGNRVAANYGLVGGRTNLHSIWDGYLAERAISTPPGGAARHCWRGCRPAERAALAGGDGRGLEPRKLGSGADAGLCVAGRRSVRREAGGAADADRGRCAGADSRGPAAGAGRRPAAGAAARRCARARGQGARGRSASAVSRSSRSPRRPPAQSAATGPHRWRSWRCGSSPAGIFST